MNWGEGEIVRSRGASARRLLTLERSKGRFPKKRKKLFHRLGSLFTMPTRHMGPRSPPSETRVYQPGVYKVK